MGGYQLSYETLHTFIANQARMAKRANEDADDMSTFVNKIKEAQYHQEAETRKDVVEELGKYLGISDEEVMKLWEAGTA